MFVFTLTDIVGLCLLGVGVLVVLVAVLMTALSEAFRAIRNLF